MRKRSEIKLLRAFGLGVIFCSGFFVVQAGEMISSPNLIEAGQKAFSFNVTSKELEPKIKLSGTSGISVPVTGGSVEIFSSGSSEITMEQQSSEIVAAFEIRPSEGLKYRIKVGQVRDFDLEYSSGSQINKLEAMDDGYLWGVGLSGSLAPGTIVSMAINWDLSFTQSTVNLDRFQGGNVVYAANQRWRQEEFQGSLGFSRRWGFIEPYGGLKLIKILNQLRDTDTKSSISGSNDGISPYVGVHWIPYEKESLFLEASFVDEKSVSAGVKIQF